MTLRRDLLTALVGAGVLRAATLPRTAPDFTWTLPDAKALKLSQLKGKIAAVSFISTG
jgi:cytochrome oxidase Cu insertion factor (SCO1/SenC/PrrC family)